MEVKQTSSSSSSKKFYHMKDLLDLCSFHKQSLSVMAFTGTLRGLLRVTPAVEESHLLKFGYLYLVDHSTSMPCQLESHDLKLSLLTSDEFEINRWNIVFYKGKPFLQIYGPLPITDAEHILKSKLQLDGITVTQARVIQFNRNKCKMKTFNICGVVECFSEINKIKHDTVFLLTLCSPDKGHAIHILVKRQELLHWQQFILPEQYIVITALQPTTLYKGKQNKEAKLFVVTSESHLYLMDDIEINYLDMNDLLENVQQLIDVPPRPLIADSNCLINFKGVITKIIDLRRYIYELDKKFRLYLTFLSHEVVHLLTVGTEITSYNVHLRRFPDQMVHLYCCHKSCIRIQRFPQQIKDQLQACRNPRFKCSVKPNTLAELQIQIDIESELEEKFSAGDIPSQAADFIYHCIYVESRERQSRSTLNEYLHHDNNNVCPIQRCTNSDAKKELITFSKLSQCLKEMSSKCINHPTESNLQQARNEGGWSSISRHYNDEPCDGWLICGVLDVSKDTSLLELKDSTGSIQCVVAPQTSHLEQKNKISNSSLVRSSSIVGTCQHHFICPDVLGKLVCLKQFSVVIEQFSNKEPNTQVSSCKYYLVFSMQDVHLYTGYQSVTQWEPQVTHDYEETSAKRLKINDASAVKEDHVVYKQLFKVITRETLHIEYLSFSKPVLAFSALVDFLGKVEKETSEDHGNICHHGIKNEKDNIIQSMEDKDSQRTVLYFTEKTTKWFSLLHPGSFFWIKKKSAVLPPDAENKIFQTTHLPDTVLMAIKNTKALLHIKVPDDVYITIKTIFEPNTSDLQTKSFEEQINDSAEQIFTVSSILNRDINKVVNVIGRLSSRSLEMSRWQQHSQTSGRYKERLDNRNHRLGAAAMGSKQLILIVQDLDDPSQCVKIFWHNENMLYPLGFLPGATILFYKLQIKLSKTGRTYLNYFTASSHWVLTVSDESVLSITHQQQLSNRPLIFLSKLWLMESQSRQQESGLLICHIHKIIYLSLHAKCNHCGSNWRGDSCSSERCSHGSSPYVCAEARCWVEDGTGTATVSFNNSQIIAKLLVLNEKQWEAVETEVFRRGTLTLTPQHISCEDPFLSFLSELVRSELVRRHVMMVVKRFRTFLTPAGDKYTSVHEFKATDFYIKRIDLGASRKTVETKLLPWLWLECLELRDGALMDLYKYHYMSPISK